MADIEITVDGGSSARLLTAGKYCDRNILVTATSGGGGGVTSASPSDVNFYDYDGTLLYSYTIAEANTLTELPQPPTHDGLTFQGWNYSLESVQTATRRMDVGATYITSDGKTRLYISVPANSELGFPPLRNQVPLYFQQTIENGVTIDWGDDSQPQTLGGIGSVNATHSYQEAGDYVITLTPATGVSLNFGDGTGQNCILGQISGTGSIYASMLKRCLIGDGVTSIGDSSFSSCNSMEYITIPDGVESIGNGAFSTCLSLRTIIVPGGIQALPGLFLNSDFTVKNIILPDSLTSIGSYAFTSCIAASEIALPPNIAGIDMYAFYGCAGLASIKIPKPVVKIGDFCFNGCAYIARIYMEPTTPPILGGESAFGGIPSDCIIYVPRGCLSAYQSAQYWATYASYMQEEPA